ncbi:ERCC4 domain-containing protein [Clostridium tyrobutyricum]|uniref:ERCC4 domain-containing protein n=1 Tax=Clostridium tyrobutyricum TaxID=1519 RepID=UPI001C392F31|nr:ERCC4 domain-containing protein [Clostridium tyrobutyricum]MBV4445328.1 ERCC4 domain-containing protein [Clostridium tyrobutyricum]MBV4445467.1 ERCC4 domain-containing protein [Clostridium tyrobutyricum]
MEVQYRFSDTEIKKLLKENFTILYDTREQQNQHILDFLDKKKIRYKKKKIDEGDYTAIITAREDMGISRDLYFNIAIERKNSVDELAGNLSAKQEDYRDNPRLIRELARAREKDIMIFLIVEDKNGKEKIETEDYRSHIRAKALQGRIKSMEINYLKGLKFLDKSESAREIVNILWYGVMEALKEKTQDIKVQ